MKRLWFTLWLLCLLAACSNDDRALHIGAGPGLPRLFAEALARQFGDAGAAVNNTELVTRQVGDCCAAVSQWGLSSRELDMAVMCPDAARMLLEKNADYLSLGPLLLSGDSLVRRAETTTPVRKVGISHQRTAQKELAQAVLPDAQVVEMLPASLPYALERGVVEAVVLDRMVAGQTPLPLVELADNTERATQVLVVHRRLLDNASALRTALQQAVDDSNSALNALLIPHKEETGWIKPLTRFVSPPASVWQKAEAGRKPPSGG